jgi:hypothetical protein
MVRTVISLTEEEKRWLDEQAAQEGVAPTELVRRAIRLLRSRQPADGRSLEELLRTTSGTWQHGDGLAYQQRVRDEW